VTRRAGWVAVELALPVAILLTWWFWSEGSHSPYWPPLSDILVAVKDNWLFERFGSDLVPTMKRVAIGFAIAVVIGVGLGVLLGASHGLRRALEPSLEFIRAIPGVAMIPISLLLFGLADSQKIFVIVFVCVWAILLNTTEGVRGIDQSFHDVARAYRFRRRERIFQVILPGATPQIFAGLRVALAQALLVGVVAELFASTNGLGHFILEAQAAFKIKEMWSGIIVLAVIAYLVNLMFVVLEQRILYWHRGWRASALGLQVDSRKRESVFKRALRLGPEQPREVRAGAG
jgi:ABC-type nitrate/sulfonate/bicarbonate transport system permease component